VTRVTAARSDRAYSERHTRRGSEGDAMKLVLPLMALAGAITMLFNGGAWGVSYL
jgi:hypothetical protein